MTKTIEPTVLAETEHRKILVVDDDRIIHRLLQVGFDAHGYQMIAASDGNAAIEMLAAKPDLVIIELDLPDIRGTELLRSIRTHIGSVPVVVLSRRGDAANKVHTLDLGAEDFITKPFGMRELLARNALRCDTECRRSAKARFCELASSAPT